MFCWSVRLVFDEKYRLLFMCKKYQTEKLPSHADLTCKGESQRNGRPATNGKREHTVFTTFLLYLVVHSRRALISSMLICIVSISVVLLYMSMCVCANPCFPRYDGLSLSLNNTEKDVNDLENSRGRNYDLFDFFHLPSLTSWTNSDALNDSRYQIYLRIAKSLVVRSVIAKTARITAWEATRSKETTSTTCRL